jgi:hypothetical protein
MKKLIILILALSIFSCSEESNGLPEFYNEVDQMLWVVSDLESTAAHWRNLGFTQIFDLGNVQAIVKSSGKVIQMKLARANLGGALVNWIQVLEGESVFTEFHDHYGDGAMSLVHRCSDRKELKNELKRLEKLRQMKTS